MTRKRSHIPFLLVLLLPLSALCQGEGQPRAAGSRIAGALVRVAPPGRFPYMCSLRRNGDATHVCGAIVVHKRWVVTAAHCVDPQVGGTGFAAELYCGIQYVNDDNEEQRYATVEGHLYDSWTQDFYQGYDIAMLKLDRDFPFAIPRLNFAGNPPGFDQSLGAIGWGKVDSTTFADELQITQHLRVTPHSECDDKWQNVNIEQETMLCTNVDVSDTCEGDSGGPLFLPHRPRNVLADGEPDRDLVYGIISFGRRNCEQNTGDDRPAVYTSIGYFSEWIQQIIEGNPGVPTQPKQEDADEPVDRDQNDGDPLKERFPYMCSIRSRGDRRHVCGGTLVHPQWVLTSAVCVDPTNLNSAGAVPVVHCGIYDVDTASDDQVFIGDSFFHEAWNGDLSKGSDIALVKLDRVADGTVPTMNSPGNTLPSNIDLTLPGWGETPTEFRPTKLQLKSRIRVVEYRTCNQLWSGLINRDTMLCAGIGENDACRGDSGSPLLQLDTPGGAVDRGSPRLDLVVGVSSFGEDACGTSTRPGIYTDVGYFREWILSTIANNTGS